MGLFKSSDKNKPVPFEVEVKDKDYRLIAVVPYKNKTKKSDYDFIGKSIQKFLTIELKNINYINISPDDIPVPRDFTNKVVFNFGTNFKRKLIVIDDETVNSKISMKEPLTNIDYIVSGNYTEYSKDEWKFTTMIFNKNSRRISKDIDCIYNYREIIENIRVLTTPVLEKVMNKPLRSILVNSFPQNTMLYADGKFIGYTPRTINITKDKTNIGIVLKKDGYDTFNLSVSRSTNILLNKARSFTKIDIRSTPAGADVMSDVTFLGKTPLLITNIAPSEFRIKIVKEGYADWFGKISIKNNETTKLNANLISREKAEKDLKKKDKYRKLMYFSLGGAVGLTLVSYYFYMKSDEYHSTIKNDTLAKEYSNYFLVSSVSGLVMYSASFYFLLKTLKKEDIQLGKIQVASDGKKVFFAYNRSF